MSAKGLNLGLISSSLYVSSQLIANILSTKIALLPFVNLTVDGGTIIYPLTFTLRDFVHKTWGRQEARQLVILAAGINGLMFALFWLIGQMTPDPGWPYQKAYNNILLPLGRVIVGSIVAQVISELIDTQVFSYAYKKWGDVQAVLISNLAGLLVDSVLFTIIAFAGTLPLSTLLQIMEANIAIKLLISIISSPAVKWIPRKANINDI